MVGEDGQVAVTAGGTHPKQTGTVRYRWKSNGFVTLETGPRPVSETYF